MNKLILITALSLAGCTTVAPQPEPKLLPAHTVSCRDAKVETKGAFTSVQGACVILN